MIESFTVRFPEAGPRAVLVVRMRWQLALSERSSTWLLDAFSLIAELRVGFMLKAFDACLEGADSTHDGDFYGVPLVVVAERLLDAHHLGVFGKPYPRKPARR